jgi:coenzyme PQQ synthesis protein D (PqqD)
MRKPLKRRPKTSARFRHAGGVAVREVGGEIFLAAARAKTIHHLDRMAAAAWRALAQPRSAAEIVALFQAAFPATPRRQIARDVGNILAFLAENKLIVRIGSKRRARRKS